MYILLIFFNVILLCITLIIAILYSWMRGKISVEYITQDFSGLNRHENSLYSFIFQNLDHFASFPKRVMCWICLHRCMNGRYRNSNHLRAGRREWGSIKQYKDLIWLWLGKRIYVVQRQKYEANNAGNRGRILGFGFVTNTFDGHRLPSTPGINCPLFYH